MRCVKQICSRLPGANWFSVHLMQVLRFEFPDKVSSNIPLVRRVSWPKTSKALLLLSAKVFGNLVAQMQYFFA